MTISIRGGKLVIQDIERKKSQKNTVMTLSPLNVLPPSIAYNLAANHYDSWSWQKFWRLNELPTIIAQLKALKPSGDVLDIGIGTGFYAHVLSQMGMTVSGIDISEEMLKVARARLSHSSKLYYGDVQDNPFRDAKYGLILANRIQSHLSHPDLLMSEVRRLLASDGVFILSDVDNSHEYEVTSLPSTCGKIPVQTYKHRDSSWTESAIRFGLRLETTQKLTINNLLWIPPLNVCKTVDRTGQRAIGFVSVFTVTRERRFVLN